MNASPSTDGHGIVHRSVAKLRDAAWAGELAPLCARWFRLPAELGTPGRTGPFSRARTFWVFLAQVLSPDGSCREAVCKLLAWQALTQEPPASSNTAAYCKARARLPLNALDQVHQDVAARLEAGVTGEDLWYGRRVRLVDGSSLSMPDTEANQGLYPQPKTQKPGCGFPVMRVVGLFSLATGALLAWAKGPLAVGEQALFRSLWNLLAPGDVALADRGFCSFAHLYLLAQRGVDAVLRKHPRRTKGLHLLKRLGKRDRLVAWHKPEVRPSWLTPEQWRQLPDLLPVREITFAVAVPGFRTRRITVATTLLDPKTYPPQAFAQLYRRRWQVELFLRDIKSTLGIHVLRCKSPHMVHRELAMHAIAYNLVRALMLEASREYGIPLHRISFKGTIQTLRQWAPLLASAALSPPQRTRMMTLLLHSIARTPLPYRPNRAEPRARKRRPKNYQLLTKPRHLFKESLHRNHYIKCQG